MRTLIEKVVRTVPVTEVIKSPGLAFRQSGTNRITIDQDIQRVEEHEIVSSETDEQVVAWLVASLSFDYFSFKQLREVVGRVVRRLYKTNAEIREKLSLLKFELRQRISGFIERETDRVTHEAFDKLFKQQVHVQ